uniref:Outer membrane protein beta-barrel domain-containing protein n=1 Tax=Romanomermis culicivorax TaxID=13658 RepID=A0A915K6Y5_ROMCU
MYLFPLSRRVQSYFGARLTLVLNVIGAKDRLNSFFVPNVNSVQQSFDTADENIRIPFEIRSVAIASSFIYRRNNFSESWTTGLGSDEYSVTKLRGNFELTTIRKTLEYQFRSLFWKI